jgi:hypothetical protein
MPTASSGASKGRTRIAALLRQSRSLAARFALKLGSTVTMTSVLATPKNLNPEHLFSTTYNRLTKRVLVTVQNRAFRRLSVRGFSGFQGAADGGLRHAQFLRDFAPTHAGRAQLARLVAPENPSADARSEDSCQSANARPAAPSMRETRPARRQRPLGTPPDLLGFAPR